ncbi:MAG: hypothetical protein ACRDTG_23910 [Pseudonocardiaceae bacterium]
MGNAPLLPHPPVGVLGLMWRPVQMVTELVRQVRDTAEYVVRQVHDAAKLVLRALDGATQQTTRVRSKSEVEWIIGPLTFFFAGGVLFARPNGTVPQ